MGTWDCVDGGMCDIWTYPSMGIVDELLLVARAINQRLPQAAIDDTALTLALSTQPAPASVEVMTSEVLEPVFTPAPA